MISTPLVPDPIRSVFAAFWKWNENVIKLAERLRFPRITSRIKSDALALCVLFLISRSHIFRISSNKYYTLFFYDDYFHSNKQA